MQPSGTGNIKHDKNNGSNMHEQKNFMDNQRKKKKAHNYVLLFYFCMGPVLGDKTRCQLQYKQILIAFL